MQPDLSDMVISTKPSEILVLESVQGAQMKKYPQLDLNKILETDRHSMIVDSCCYSGFKFSFAIGIFYMPEGLLQRSKKKICFKILC